MTRIRLLIVDDSATMRELIRRAVASDPLIEVVGTACDAREARAAIKALDPDVVTLDIEMPDMNGLDLLDRIMRLRPTPVVMVSSLTRERADATVRALELGAFDCVGKPSPSSPQSLDVLPRIIRAAARGRRPAPLVPLPHRGPGPAVADRRDRTSNVQVVALAASTGGVEALLRVFAELPANSPPVVVVQHMPPLFTSSLARRLDRVSPLSVSEATDGAVLAPGVAVIAPGGETHLEVVGGRDRPLRCRLVADAPTSGHRPSADRLFSSVAQKVGARSLGVILTGMGADGARGLLAMRQAGAHTIGQDEATSVVFGMPGSALRLGAVAEQLPLQHVAAGIARSLFTS
ncbi:protein-glutamate methylesterase/protein-glutamine glutaminase [Rubellimicrobium aerolatum]|uniref:Protein-glutamate methylesterase/protein-glutamine glutaminase n=1 Tax=Rubellimicrobium aerolatum TaxID=490979 RepID=A0ABW0SHB4_9RHOB|nr:chemotaxis response regulator protein-glutamate methylesterase [Rubellimicrobium aerolatum]MBP1807579.1 two-component system chemotaxis response regulator CheB [Rubellimicrobium aerolatum]